MLKTAKVFQNGRSQAIRLPKEYRFNSADVYIKRLGSMIILIPKNNPWKVLLDSLDQFSDDFMIERSQPLPQRRRILP